MAKIEFAPLDSTVTIDPWGASPEHEPLRVEPLQQGPQPAREIRVESLAKPKPQQIEFASLDEPRSPLTDIPRGVVRGAGQMVESAGGAMQMVPEVVAGTVNALANAPGRQPQPPIVGVDPNNPMTQAGQQIARAGREIQSYGPRDENVVSPFDPAFKGLSVGERWANALRWLQSGAAEQAPQLALSMGASKVLEGAGRTAQAVGFAAPTAVQEAGGDFEQITQGMTPEQRQSAAVLLAARGGVAAALERLPFEGMTNSGGRMARIAGGVLGEGSTEGAQEATGAVANATAGDPNAFDNLPRRIAEASTLGAVTGGLFGGAMGGGEQNGQEVGQGQRQGLLTTEQLTSQGAKPPAKPPTIKPEGPRKFDPGQAARIVAEQVKPQQPIPAPEIPAQQPVTPSEPPAGQSWQMTREQFIAAQRQRAIERAGGAMPADWAATFERDAASSHRKQVRDAVLSGQQVPAEVLADYPSLQRRAAGTYRPRARVNRLNFDNMHGGSLWDRIAARGGINPNTQLAAEIRALLDGNPEKQRRVFREGGADLDQIREALSQQNLIPDNGDLNEVLDFLSRNGNGGVYTGTGEKIRDKKFQKINEQSYVDEASIALRDAAETQTPLDPQYYTDAKSLLDGEKTPKERVRASELIGGSEVQIQGEKFKVEGDPETEGVILKDGVTLKAGPEAEIEVDKGSLVAAEADDGFTFEPMDTEPASMERPAEDNFDFGPMDWGNQLDSADSNELVFEPPEQYDLFGATSQPAPARKTTAPQQFFTENAPVVQTRRAPDTQQPDMLTGAMRPESSPSAEAKVGPSDAPKDVPDMFAQQQATRTPSESVDEKARRYGIREGRIFTDKGRSVFKIYPEGLVITSDPERGRSYFAAFSIDEIPALVKADNAGRSYVARGLDDVPPPPKYVDEPPPQTPAKPYVLPGKVRAAIDRLKAPAPVGIVYDPKTEAARWKQTTDDILTVGRHYISQGINTAREWVAQMKRVVTGWTDAALGRLYDAIAPRGGLLASPGSSQRGAVSIKKPAGVSPRAKMRQFNERVAADPEYAADKAGIESNPESWYEPQNLGDMKADLSQLHDAELWKRMRAGEEAGKTGNANDATLAGIELINREHAAGRSVEPVVEELGKLGTNIGQLLRQFAELKSSTPNGLLVIIKSKWAKEGRYMTRPIEQRMMARITADMQARQAASAAAKTYRAAPTDANAKALEQARREADATNEALIIYVRQLSPRNLGSMLSTFMQGNLMTPVSLAVNAVGNVVNLPPRVAAKSLASALDTAWSIATGQGRTVMSPIGNTLAYLRGAGKGAAQGKRIARSGNVLGRDLLRDVEHGFQPIRAAMQAVGQGDMLVALPKGKRATEANIAKLGKVPISDRVLKGIEAIGGAAPETIFRGLAIGDAPFYEAAYRSALNEIGRTKGLKGNALETFIAAPDAASTREASKRADVETYRQDNPATPAVAALKRLIKEIPWVGEYVNAFGLTPVAPFTTTPLNLFFEGAQFLVPPISLAQTIYNTVKGNRRAALMSAGRFVVGSTILSTAYWLASMGLAAGSPDKDEKMREMQYAGLKPGFFNWSGFDRLMKNQSPEFQPGDEIMRYDKLGYFGLALQMFSDRRERLNAESVKQGERIENDLWPVMTGMVPELGSAMLNQTFLKGQLGLLQALSDSRFADNYMRQHLEALTAMVIPGTLSAIGMATQDAVPELKSESAGQAIKNVVEKRLGPLGDTDQLPPKRDSFGRPIRRTPEGRNPWLYNLADVLKIHDTPQDKIGAIAAQVWQNTLDSGVWPSRPERVQPDRSGNPVELDDKQYDRLQEIVGQERLKRIETRLPAIEKAQPFKQVDIMKDAYREGLEIGRRKFLLEQERAGAMQRSRRLSPRQKFEERRQRLGLAQPSNP